MRADVTELKFIWLFCGYRERIVSQDNTFHEVSGHFLPKAAFTRQNKRTNNHTNKRTNNASLSEYLFLSV